MSDSVKKDQTKPKNKGGRPFGAKGSKTRCDTKYQSQFVKIAEELCARGATDDNLASAFEVSCTTIKAWYLAHPEFRAAVLRGKAEVFDPLVERALAQRAIGYAMDIEEVKIDKEGNEIRYTIRKHFPPDVTAGIFWMTNRQPGKWQNMHNHKHEGKIEAESKSAEELLNEIKADLVKLGISDDAVDAFITNGVAPKQKH